LFVAMHAWVAVAAAVAALALAASGGDPEYDGSVYVGTDANFDKFIETNPYVLVEFCEKQQLSPPFTSPACLRGRVLSLSVALCARPGGCVGRFPALMSICQH
jgi:hypothetical protein